MAGYQVCQEQKANETSELYDQESEAKLVKAGLAFDNATFPYLDVFASCVNRDLATLNQIEPHKTPDEEVRDNIDKEA